MTKPPTTEPKVSGRHTGLRSVKWRDSQFEYPPGVVVLYYESQTSCIRGIKRRRNMVEGWGGGCEAINEGLFEIRISKGTNLRVGVTPYFS